MIEFLKSTLAFREVCDLCGRKISVNQILESGEWQRPDEETCQCGAARRVKPKQFQEGRVAEPVLFKVDEFSPGNGNQCGNGSSIEYLASATVEEPVREQSQTSSFQSGALKILSFFSASMACLGVFWLALIGVIHFLMPNTEAAYNLLHFFNQYYLVPLLGAVVSHGVIRVLLKANDGEIYEGQDILESFWHEISELGLQTVRVALVGLVIAALTVAVFYKDVEWITNLIPTLHDLDSKNAEARVHLLVKSADANHMPSALVLLGIAHKNQDHYKHSTDAFNKALEYLREDSNKNMELRITAMVELADLYQRHKQYASAERLLYSALTTLRTTPIEDPSSQGFKLFGPYYWNVYDNARQDVVLNRLAELNIARKKVKGTGRMIKEAIKISLGEGTQNSRFSNPETQLDELSAIHLRSHLRTMGHYLKTFRTNWRTAIGSSYDEHSRNLTDRLSHSPAELARYYRGCALDLKKLVGDVSPSEMVLKYARKHVKWTGEAYGRRSLEYVSSLIELANHEAEQGLPTEARSTFARALALISVNDEAYDLKVATVKRAYGKFLLRTSILDSYRVNFRDLEESERLLKQSYEQFSQAKGSESREAALSLSLLAECYNKQKMPYHAADAYEKSLSVLERPVMFRAVPSYKRQRLDYASILRGLGKVDQARTQEAKVVDASLKRK